jgi:hypothetical protein
MNRDECRTEEWWNVISNVAYVVPIQYAYSRQQDSTALATSVVLIASTVRHWPRHLLGSTLLDLFRGADFTAVGILLFNMMHDQQGGDFPWLWALLYVLVSNAVFFSVDTGFPWSVAAIYYAGPLLYTVLTPAGRALMTSATRQAGQFILILALCVMLRMTEQKSVAPALGFHEGGTECIPDHGMWHVASAALLTHVILSYQNQKHLVELHHEGH